MSAILINQPGRITSKMRETFLGQKGYVLWFTGLSGAGKSTIAYKLEEKLYEQEILSYVLDGDNIRQGLNKNLGFTPEGRKENIRRIAEVASLFVNAGIITIVSFISPFTEDRKMAESIISREKFIEIYIQASLEVCEQRDPKGMYKKARSGIIQDFTGISSPYEPPLFPDIIINTEELTISQSIQHIIKHLIDNNIVKLKQ